MAKRKKNHEETPLLNTIFPTWYRLLVIFIPQGKQKRSALPFGDRLGTFDLNFEPIVKKAIDMLKTLDIPFEVHVYSAHRTPVEACDFALSARALVVNTTVPVIGVSCKGGALDGNDALLSTVKILTVFL